MAVLIGLCVGAGTGALRLYARSIVRYSGDRMWDILVAVGAVFLLTVDSPRALGDLPGTVGQIFAYGAGIILGACVGVLVRSLAHDLLRTVERPESQEQQETPTGKR